MENEIQVPDFVNDNYYKRKYYENSETLKENKKTIKKLKIYNKTLKLIAFGAVLVAVASYPKTQQVMKDFVDHTIEYDNAKFDSEKEAQAIEVEEMTGMTPEEITERGLKR